MARRRHRDLAPPAARGRVRQAGAADFASVTSCSPYSKVGAPLDDALGEGARHAASVLTTRHLHLHPSLDGRFGA